MEKNKYTGTETEKNLRTAFSGESEARNKYTFLLLLPRKRDMNRLPHYFRKRQIMKKNMQKCGLKN